MCSATGLLAKVERATLICDQTGCGRPICDLFRARLKGKLVAVTITGGHETTVAGDRSWHVPKKNLVSAVQATLQTETRFFLGTRSEEHTSELPSPDHLVCRLLLE